MKKYFAVLITFLLLASTVSANDIRFAQVSDVRYSNDNADAFKNVIKDINKQKCVKFVVFTGDVINRPDEDNLVMFIKEAKNLNCPFYIALGEHDVNKHKNLSKSQFFKILKQQFRKTKQETPNYVFMQDGLVFIILDGSKDIIPSSNGFYKDDTLGWLEEQLELYSNNKIIIFQHFPIIPPVNRENYYTFKPEKYLSLLQKHTNVKAIFTGHFGVNKEENRNGILYITTAGLPFYRLVDVLDTDSESPIIWTTLREIK